MHQRRLVRSMHIVPFAVSGASRVVSNRRTQDLSTKLLTGQ